MTQLLSGAVLATEIASIPGWEFAGAEIRRKFVHKDFVHAVGFVNEVALLAERENHHPDIDIRWNIVHLTLSTHSAGGLTMKDISLARSINEL